MSLTVQTAPVAPRPEISFEPMTTTPRTDSGSRAATSGAEILLVLLEDALSVAAEHDPDRLDSGTAAGRALVSLAAVAREAAGALGVDPGPRLTAGPGVVVVRELATAARLLDRAASRAAADRFAWEMDVLVVTARGLHARLIDAVASTRR